VTFESSEVKDSQNGIRIKTISGDTGSVTSVTYKSITLSGITEYGVTVRQGNPLSSLNPYSFLVPAPLSSSNSLLTKPKTMMTLETQQLVSQSPNSSSMMLAAQSIAQATIITSSVEMAHAPIGRGPMSILQEERRVLVVRICRAGFLAKLASGERRSQEETKWMGMVCRGGDRYDVDIGLRNDMKILCL
jgi:hypothetical protein